MHPVIPRVLDNLPPMLVCLLSWFNTYYTSQERTGTCPPARPSPNNEQLPKLFCCTCVITDTCPCTCRFVSMHHCEYTDTNVYVHISIHPHATQKHTTMYTQDGFFPLYSAYIYLNTTTTHTHMHIPPCAPRMESLLCIVRAIRGVTGLWRCSFRLGLQ